MDTMTEDKTYNGWANYPTWNVNLWLSNDEGLYRETLARTSDVLAGRYSEDGAKPEYPRVAVADMLKDFVQDLAGEAYTEASFVADLLGYALDSVDWFEIADAWLEQVSDD